MFLQKNTRKTPDHIIQYAKSQIREIYYNVSGIHFIMICTTDGFELSTLYKSDHYNRTKLAAVSSSLHAMVSALMSELKLEGCQSITLDAENGKAILTAVSSSKYPMIIVTLADKNILLGQLLYMLKNTSTLIEMAE